LISADSVENGTRLDALKSSLTDYAEIALGFRFHHSWSNQPEQFCLFRLSNHQHRFGCVAKESCLAAVQPRASRILTPNFAEIGALRNPGGEVFGIHTTSVVLFCATVESGD
jgi:hypothetical protein